MYLEELKIWINAEKVGLLCDVEEKKLHDGKLMGCEFAMLIDGQKVRLDDKSLTGTPEERLETMKKLYEKLVRRLIDRDLRKRA